ncbi:MAG TPA: hypothetical protein VGY98_01905 [Verrucomicrobiae bacterium]|nr:hypothetical protein [Verrucomicrobiae bacterium]
MAFFALQKMQGEEMYLALVGPPPLRFEPAAVNDPVFIGELMRPKPAGTQATVTILPTNAPSVTASVTSSSASSNVSRSDPPPGSLTDAAKRAEGLGGPASNLLSIMPQMMTEYLKPIRNEGGGDTGGDTYQPGDTIFVPAELGFVPPMPGQNRAIYQSR